MTSRDDLTWKLEVDTIVCNKFFFDICHVLVIRLKNGRKSQYVQPDIQRMYVSHYYEIVLIGLTPRLE